MRNVKTRVVKFVKLSVTGASPLRFDERQPMDIDHHGYFHSDGGRSSRHHRG